MIMKYYKWCENHLYLHNIQFSVHSGKTRGHIDGWEGILILLVKMTSIIFNFCLYCRVTYIFLTVGI